MLFMNYLTFILPPSLNVHFLTMPCRFETSNSDQQWRNLRIFRRALRRSWSFCGLFPQLNIWTEIGKASGLLPWLHLIIYSNTRSFNKSNVICSCYFCVMHLCRGKFLKWKNAASLSAYIGWHHCLFISNDNVAFVDAYLCSVGNNIAASLATIMLPLCRYISVLSWHCCLFVSNDVASLLGHICVLLALLPLCQQR